MDEKVTYKIELIKLDTQAQEIKHTRIFSRHLYKTLIIAVFDAIPVLHRTYL